MKTLIAIILALLLCWVRPTLSAELVVNGSFETPTIGEPGNECISEGAGWAYCPSVVTGLGWTVEWVYSGAPGNLEFQDSRVGLGRPYLGLQYVEMDTHNSPGGVSNANVRIYQDLKTCSGNYNIGYAWRPRPGVASTSNVLEVYWGGILVATHTGTQTGNNIFWTEEGATLPASLGITRLEFKGGGDGDQLGMFLDAVSVDGADPRLANACTTINIKLGSDPNSINTCSQGATPVTIWGSENFDVYMIDPESLTLASAEVKTVGKSGRFLCNIADVGSPNPSYFDNFNPNPDGWPDMTCHFITYDLDLNDSSTEAELKMKVCPNGYNNGCKKEDITLLATDAVNIVKDCNQIFRGYRAPHRHHGWGHNFF